MIIELLLLVFIVWAVFCISSYIDTKDILNRMRIISDRITIASKYQIPKYNLIEGNVNTHTYFKNGDYPCIVICLRKSNGIEFYDDETLTLAMIHEMAHVLSPTPDHSKEFDDIEDRLFTSAVRMGYLKHYSKLDNEYPCVS